jgi:hypothetical protein
MLFSALLFCSIMRFYFCLCNGKNCHVPYNRSMDKEIQRCLLFNDLVRICKSSKCPKAFAQSLILCAHTKPSNFKIDTVFPDSFSDGIFEKIQTNPIEKFAELKKKIRSKLAEALSILKDMKGGNVGFEITTEKRENNVVLFCNSQHDVTFTRHAYNRVYDIWKFHNPKKNQHTFDEQLWQAGYRYKYLGMFSGMSASIPPKTLKDIHSIFPSATECFASFFNHTIYTNGYYGLFYDIEKSFGCKGNFFAVKKVPEMIICNPPFEKCVLNCFVKHVLKLHKLQKFHTLAVIPAFAIEDRIKLNLVCTKYRSHEPYKTDYKTDVLYEDLKVHENIEYCGLFCKDSFPYIDMFTNKTTFYTSTLVSYISNSNDTRIKNKICRYLNGSKFPKEDISFTNL